jgi:hypothetical protein
MSSLKLGLHKSTWKLVCVTLPPSPDEFSWFDSSGSKFSHLISGNDGIKKKIKTPVMEDRHTYVTPTNADW